MPAPAQAASSGTEKPRSSGGAAGYTASGNTSYSQDVPRVLPHNLEAEQSLLGSMLIAPTEVIDECIPQIKEDAFYLPAHATIFALLVELRNQGLPVDVVILTNTLRERKQLEAIGGAAYLSELIDQTPTAANAQYYLEIVRDKFILRRIITSCTTCAMRAYDDQGEVNLLLDDVERDILAITEDRVQQVPKIKDQVMEAIETLELLYERRGAITGLETGFKQLDRMTSGLHGSEMIVIAARPSMGKTALAMNIAEHAAINGKHAVAVFSLEMSSPQLIQRLLGSMARVNLKKLRDGFLSERDFPNLTHAASKLADSQMFLDDTSGLTILELRAKARRLKKQYDIKLIVIDYLQLLRSPSRRAQENRQLEISEISAGVKALAKELDIPIIVLAQLNRNPESRSGEAKGRPRLSDLRESGSIEQDADVVGLLVREKYYADTDEEKAEAEGKATLIIAKQRNGPTDDVRLTFIEDYTRFEDRADAREPA